MARWCFLPWLLMRPTTMWVWPWKPEYLLVRCEDERTESLAEEDYWASAAEYADSCGVDIINSSLGYHGFDDAAMNHHYYEQDGNTALISHTASMCADKGIVCVNSAGNDGMGLMEENQLPCRCQGYPDGGQYQRAGHECRL